MSAIKAVALIEPLVDVVDPKQVNCSHAVIKEIDIQTGKNKKYLSTLSQKNHSSES